MFLHMILAGISEQASLENIFTVWYSSFSGYINNIQEFTCFITAQRQTNSASPKTANQDQTGDFHPAWLYLVRGFST